MSASYLPVCFIYTENK